jgi:curli biogenesis system outer membrane secretion channel CsgG
MIPRSALLRWIIFFVCCNGLWSCRSGGPVIQPNGVLTGTEHVLVLPYKNLAWLYGESVNVRSPLTGKVFMTGPVAEGADRLLTDMLLDALRQETRFQTVSSSEAPGVLDALQSSSDAQRSPLKSLAQTGRMLNADLVFQGYVYRYKDRVGKDFSAESAASVAFDLYLIDSRAQKVVWAAYLDETQQALADDLRFIGTFFRRGARWITADEMASEAMTEMFKGFE